MYNVHKRLLLVSFFLCLITAGLCEVASAQITGNALFSYDVTREDGNWTGELEQNISLGTRGKVGLDSFLGLNLGVLQRDREWDLGQLSPIYNLNLRNKYYSLLSGYSVHIHRDITNSRLYENLRVFFPNLPTLRVSYVRQSTRDIPEKNRMDSTGNNILLELEDEFGPFHLTLDRREYFLTDRVRGSQNDVRSSKTSGNAIFKYFYERLFSLQGRYRLDLFRTKRGLSEERTESSQNLFLDFRVRPVSTIVLSGTTIGRLGKREGWQREISSNSLTNKFHLMLQPIEGVLLNAIYSRNDFSRGESGSSSNENKSLAINLEPWQSLVLSGNFSIYDSQENGKNLFRLRRTFFSLGAKPINGLRFLSQLHLSKSDYSANGIRSDRNNAITTLEAIPTRNLRTSISHDWQKFGEETQQRIMFTVNYFPAQMLNLKLRFGRDTSSEWEGSGAFLTCGFNYSIYGSYVNLRYNRSNRPGVGSLSPSKKQWITQTFTIDFSQNVGGNNNLRLSYQSRISGREFSNRNAKRISLRANIRF